MVPRNRDREEHRPPRQKSPCIPYSRQGLTDRDDIARQYTPLLTYQVPGSTYLALKLPEILVARDNIVKPKTLPFWILYVY